MPAGRLSLTEERELLRRYARGEGARSLGLRYGMTPGSVRSLASRRDVRSSRSSAPTATQRALVLSLHADETRSPTTLGRAAGLSRWSVLRILRRAGVTSQVSSTDATVV
jgi:hypothetical protein